MGFGTNGRCVLSLSSHCLFFSFWWCWKPNLPFHYSESLRKTVDKNDLFENLARSLFALLLLFPFCRSIRSLAWLVSSHTLSLLLNCNPSGHFLARRFLRSSLYPHTKFTMAIKEIYLIPNLINHRLFLNHLLAWPLERLNRPTRRPRISARRAL